jgi:hypothetical protein
MSISRFGLWGKTRITVGVASLVFLSVVGVALAASLPPGGSFSDDDGNIHEAAIEAIAAEGITRGCNPPINDLYCPSTTVTRGQMAAFLVRALDLPSTSDTPFTDAAGVFEDSINRLAAAGITRGCNPPTNDLFCPNSPVKRDQMASFLTRALGLTPIVPPPPTSSTTTTTSDTTGTTLPPVGPAATFTACGDDTVGDEFSLREFCVAATVYNSAWAQASYPNVISYLWLDPDGQSVRTCPVSGNCSAVDYHYSSGFLMGWTFYFYVDGEDRDPGWHSLEMWAGTSGDEFQTLLLRDHFKLSDIVPVPAPEPRPNVSWECSNNPDDSRTCTGNTDTLDPAAETWTCTPVPGEYPEDDPDWDCAGDIDKRSSGNESWFCESGDYCSGDIDTSDAVDETWRTSWGGWVYNGSFSSGDIDKSTPGSEKWECDITATGLSCSAEWQPWEWTCTGDYRADWSCSGSVGRLAPIVGPVPSDEGEW